MENHFAWVLWIVINNYMLDGHCTFHGVTPTIFRLLNRSIAVQSEIGRVLRAANDVPYGNLVLITY